MEFKTQGSISSSDIILLKQFEQDLLGVIKNKSKNANSDWNFDLKLTIELIDRGVNKPIFLDSNNSFNLSGSQTLFEAVKRFTEKKEKELLACLKEYTLHIILNFSKKEKQSEQKENNVEQKNDETPDFFPSKPLYVFDQMILSDKVRKDVFDALKIIQCKNLVYDTWGFGEIDPCPRSVLNFFGEPGTGKTMCAHAVASYLGKDILLLNYGEIESKYVGEAPKNLQKAFKVAKETDSVLFFDEADSFLGKRIQNVSHGSDQALNSLRSQMLILLEEFNGVVIFATNLVTNFDKAFESRILKHIKFELPNKEARAEIIKKKIPSRLPIEVPFTDAEILEASDIIDGFSGREIKNAILDMLLDKANSEQQDNIIFTIEDLKRAFANKKEEKDKLKAEENKIIKDRIIKKLSEKNEEAKIEQEYNEQHNSNGSEEEKMTEEYEAEKKSEEKNKEQLEK